MGAPTMVEYEGKTMRATALARRIGVSPGCIIERWNKGLRGDDLVTSSTRAHRCGPKTQQQQDLADKKQRIWIDPNAHSKELRRRARDKAARLALELAAELRRPLIDAKLLTKAERLENALKVKGTQRWNSAWFGESRDSRESGR